MIIKQEKEYRPLVITLETVEEYNSFFKIIDESMEHKRSVFMDDGSCSLAKQLAHYADNNTQE